MKITELTSNLLQIQFPFLEENIYYLKDKNILDENYQDLCAVVSALEQKDADQARSLAQQHVRKFSEYMELENQKLRRKKA